jgi:hypothetical protein
MRVALPVVLSPEDRGVLELRARARRATARSVERARIILLAADGWRNQDIAAHLHMTPEKVARWRQRFLAGGLAAIAQDAPRAGRPRTMAAAMGLSERSVRRIWQRHGLKPRCLASSRLSGQRQLLWPVRKASATNSPSSSMPGRSRT